MATVTKPMALDESLNTTETNPRNIADVLAEELGRIVDVVKPDAEDVDYDNTSSGLSATNVQDAIDEIEEDISDIQDKIDVSLESVSGNPLSISGLKSSQLAVNPVITFEPIQDLHGQSKPYPAGGGKNLAPLEISAIKGQNIAGTWNGNVYTINGGTFTIQTDSAGNVTGILANGNFTSQATFYITQNVEAYFNTVAGKSIILSGCPSGGSSNSYVLGLWVNGGGSVSDIGNGASYTYPSTYASNNIAITCFAGQTTNKLFKPMIRLSTESDSSFAPYENICPISGYDKIEVLSCGKNLVDGKLSGYAINANGTFASETGYDVVYAPVVKGASYVISSDGNATMAWFTNKPTATSQAYDSSRYTYTVGVAIIAPITGWIAFRTVTNCANSQIEYGSTQSTYEPPIKIIDLSESLGRTVYGATLDVRTGVLTVTHNAVDMGNLAWTKIVDGSYTYFRSENITDMYPAVYTSSDLVCSCYQTAPVPAPQIPDASIRFYNNAQMLIVFDSRYTDATSLQTALVGQKVGYPLATPFTIQLTPREISLLKDYVYVSTNGTNIQFDYHNGELASLADVAQLAETYNRFADYIKGLINV